MANESIFTTVWAIRTAFLKGQQQAYDDFMRQLTSTAIFYCMIHNCGGTVPCHLCKESHV